MNDTTFQSWLCHAPDARLLSSKRNCSVTLHTTCKQAQKTRTAQHSTWYRIYIHGCKAELQRALHNVQDARCNCAQHAADCVWHCLHQQLSHPGITSCIHKVQILTLGVGVGVTNL